MTAPRTVLPFVLGAVSAGAALVACHEAAKPEVPPLTVAPASSAPIFSGPITDARLSGAARAPVGGGALAADAGPPAVGSVGAVASGASVASAAPVARFVQVPANIEPATCGHTLVAVVQGAVKVLGESLKTGDALVARQFHPLDLTGGGLVVVAYAEDERRTCEVAKMGETKLVVRADAAPELRWAGGAMRAHLDVGANVSPVYMGRLEGTAPVAEHAHATSWEVLAAVEASGTFTLDGTEHRLGPRQVVAIRPGVKHSWKPDAGSKLVAIQLYSPPGPEQRFVALAAAEADGGAGAGPGKRVSTGTAHP